MKDHAPPIGIETREDPLYLLAKAAEFGRSAGPFAASPWGRPR
jgi:hypothetical protein